MIASNKYQASNKGLSIKKHPQSGGGLSSAKILQTRRGRVFTDAKARTFTFWCKKLRIFRNLRCVRTDKRGREVSQFGHFSDKGGWGSTFSRLCTDVFYRWPPCNAMQKLYIRYKNVKLLIITLVVHSASSSILWTNACWKSYQFQLLAPYNR